ncbi:swr1 complex component [Coemansia sp. RSA 988]|nr:swr1 complex component [Coemansia sp. RSA 988]
MTANSVRPRRRGRPPGKYSTSRNPSAAKRPRLASPSPVENVAASAPATRGRRRALRSIDTSRDEMPSTSEKGLSTNEPPVSAVTPMEPASTAPAALPPTTPVTSTPTALICPSLFARHATAPKKSDVARLDKYLRASVTLPDDTVLSSLPQPKMVRRAPGAMTAPTSRKQPDQLTEQELTERMRTKLDEWIADTAHRLYRISQLRRQGMLRDSEYAVETPHPIPLLLPPPLPEPAERAQEPPRRKTAWDQLLTDVVDRHRELIAISRRRRALLRKRARQIAREDDERKACQGIFRHPELAARAELEQKRRLAKWTAQQVLRKWTHVRSIVDEQRLAQEEEVRSREGKRVLFDMLQRSTRLLAEQRAENPISDDDVDSEGTVASSSLGPDHQSELDDQSQHDHQSEPDGQFEQDEQSEISDDSSDKSSFSSDDEMAGLAEDQDIPMEALLESHQQMQQAENAMPKSLTTPPSSPGIEVLAEQKRPDHAIPQPELLRGNLREYQRQGLDWLVTLHQHQTSGILADEMGLGKTVQTIALLAHLACARGIWGPHLIIVPTSVLLNWEQELLRWLPGFKVITYYGSRSERKERRRGWSRPNSFHVCITSYQLAIQDASVFRRKPWYYMVLDEAQAIKNFRSQRWQTLLLFKSRMRLLLTGTPLQNSLMELWALMYFLMPAQLDIGEGFAGIDRFREWFALPLERLLSAQPEIAAPIQNHMDLNTTAFLQSAGTDSNDADLLATQSDAQNAVQKLHTVLRPHILRRLKQDVEKELPAKVEHVVYCQLSKRQRFLYDDFMSRAQTTATLRGGSYLGVMGCLMQLRKVCNHPDLFESRPIVTSWATSGAAVAAFRRTEDLVRRMLLTTGCTPSLLSSSSSSPRPWQSAEAQEIWAQRGLVFSLSERQQGAALAQQSIARLDATSLLLRRGLHAAQTSLGIIVSEEKSWDELQLRPRESRFRNVDDSVRQLKYAAARRSEDSWMHLFAQNRLRVRQSVERPSYGAPGLDRLVPSLRRRLEGCAALDLVPTGEQLLERHSNIVTRFVFVTPRVVVTNSPAGREAVHAYLRPSSELWMQREQQPTILHMRRRVVRNTGVVRALEVRQQIAFPEPFLLQYDCGKLQALDRLLRRLVREGHRVLVFTQMTRVLDILERWLNLHGLRYLRLDGATRVEQRWRLTERFNCDPRWHVFISSTRAGGLGINLTGADTVIFYDSDWNHAMDAQCQDRCHRIGQLREVHIYRLISRNSVEEAIWRKQCEKRWLDHVVIQQGRFDPNATSAVVGSSFADKQPLPAGSPSTAALTVGDWYSLASSVLQQSSGAAAGDKSIESLAETNGAVISEPDAVRVLSAAEDDVDAAALKVAIAEVAQADALDLGDDHLSPPSTAGVNGNVNADINGPATEKDAEDGDEGFDDGIGHIDDFMVRFVSSEAV